MSCTVVIKDKNLKPENIKTGITILKVTGTFEGGGGGEATNWIEEARLGNITDISGYSIAKLVKKAKGASGLFMNSSITSMPRIQDAVDNPNSDVGEGSLKQAFSGCSSLKNVDMSIGSISGEGMRECFASSSVVDASIYVGAINNSAYSLFADCFSNCLYLHSLYIHLGPDASILGSNAFNFICDNSGSFGKDKIITIEGLKEVNESALLYAFSQITEGTITVNLPDGLSTVKGKEISGAFQNICQGSHLAGKTTPSFLGKLDYINGNSNFDSAFAGTDVETATLGFNTCIGSNNFAGALNGCDNLKSITFDGSFNVSGDYNFDWTFGNSYSLTSMTCTSTAGTKPFRYNDYNNVASSASEITDITIDNVNSDVYLLWNPSINAASVYGILSKATGATVQEGDTRTISFYESGLTVTDFEDGRIQTAYNAAVADGWTINNLTINPHV